MSIAETTPEIISAVEAWAAETVAELNTYDYPPEDLGAAMPLAIAEVTGDALKVADENLLSKGQYQQTFLRVHSVDLVLLVNPNPAWTASAALYEMVDILTKALRRDSSLGNRVHGASPLYDASYEPPEVEYADGTVARQVTINLSIGTTVPV